MYDNIYINDNIYIYDYIYMYYNDMGYIDYYML